MFLRIQTLLQVIWYNPSYVFDLFENVSGCHSAPSVASHVTIVAGGQFHHRIALVAGWLGVRQTRSHVVPHHLPCEYRFYMGHNMSALRASVASMMGSHPTNTTELAFNGLK
jgi:hypothetical protein